MTPSAVIPDPEEPSSTEPQSIVLVEVQLPTAPAGALRTMAGADQANPAAPTPTPVRTKNCRRDASAALSLLIAPSSGCRACCAALYAIRL
ncbi:MAG: hypothetical protein U5R31_17830 [Acidimicrobiia bacterium]|nr:hypothetical protein [Acidimicrobiia bacterium]